MHRVATTTAFGLFLAAGTGVVLGMGVFTFNYAEGTSYLSNDPAACVNCHIMRDQYDGWRKSTHHAVATCNDCHVPHGLIPKFVTKAQNGWNHSSRFTLQNFPEPIRITPANAQRLEHNCIGCHREMVGELFPEAPHGSSQDLHCVKCHAGVGHGPRR